MKFVENLCYELKNSPKNQKELAAEIGIKPSNITDWKKGQHFPSLETFYKLCIALDVSADYLLGLED